MLTSPWIIIFVLILFSRIAVVMASFQLYYTDPVDRNKSGNPFYDCLLYHVLDDIVSYNTESFRPTYALISYCIRPTQSDEANEIEINGSFTGKFSFQQLRQMEFSAEDILSVSGSIDMAEHYQEYIENGHESSPIQTLYNCTYGWFGPMCQYTFDVDVSFDYIVKSTFLRKWNGESLSYNNLTCYIHIKCDQGPTNIACLDWREVCDGKVDCLNNGVDEVGCFELETNECGKNEFRCQNGMCIPRQQFNDNLLNPDCLDSTDEYLYQSELQKHNSDPAECYQDPSFRCEESDRRGKSLYVVCGDGQRTYPFFPDIFGIPNCKNSLYRTIITSIYSYAENTHLSYHCWLALCCVTNYKKDCGACNVLCEDTWNDYCEIYLHRYCVKESRVFPRHALLDGHIRFAYAMDKFVTVHLYKNKIIFPDYVCFNVKRMPFLQPTVSIDNFTCVDTESLGYGSFDDLLSLSRSALPIDVTGNETHCLHTSLYHCLGSSKCISKHRILDGYVDCYGGSDELYNESCALHDDFRFKCTSEKKCVSNVATFDGEKQCLGGEDEYRLQRKSSETIISFPHICNGFTHMKPVLIDGHSETDETNCEAWPCNNVYTRCDNAWSCPDGNDERYCENPWCSFDEHPCISVVNHTIICLPLHKVSDDHIDCLGASDEREYCHKSSASLWNQYRCQRNVTEHLCEETGMVCESLSFICPYDDPIADDCVNNPMIHEILSTITNDALKELTHKHFRLKTSRKTISSSDQQVQSFSNAIRLLHIDTDTYIPFSARRVWICNRGILIFVGRQKIERCLCPPSFYGAFCQYQNQRVSLTIQFRLICAPKCGGAFGMIVTLFDSDHETYSHEQILYIPARDCGNKSNIYLLYRSRPKNMSMSYYVRIDAYEKFGLNYYTSWILPIPFLFQPVNRISTRLIILSTADTSHQCCTFFCGGNGQCTRAANTGQLFCRCNSGWKGIHCTVPHKQCNCSSDSICLGPNICLCPLNKRGPRCFFNSSCQPNHCQNGGTCIPNNEQLFENQFSCICLDGFSGPRCETVDSRIIIQFTNDIPIPQLLFIHFVAVQNNSDPIVTSIARKIFLDQDLAIIYTNTPSNLMFAQTDTNYYFIFLQEIYTTCAKILIDVKSAARCPHVRELLGRQTENFPLIRRIKYYHTICLNKIDLSCFYDDKASLMCLCDRDRHANCFPFDKFNKTYDCHTFSDCENGGSCFQNRPTCPTTCVCQECYYGSKCQFTTKGISLQLDTILGYRIRSGISIIHQPIVVKVSVALAFSIAMFGLLNGLLSIIIFQNRKFHNVGSGLYLFFSSITSIVSIFVFVIKFSFLLLSQMSVITSRTSVNINCILVEFCLRSLLVINDWLIAAVSTERALTVILGVSFNRKKSCRMAKWVVFGIIIITFLSHIHDSLHRKIVTDEEEGRTWCQVHYSSLVSMYNSTLHIVHLLLPFSINCFSAIIIIVKTAQSRSTAQKRSNQNYLREQFHHYKYLLIGPVVLVLLALPRLIIVFASGCMKSSRNPWLFLTGYFISFVPLLLTFIIFVLPSHAYKSEFDNIIKRQRHIFINTFGIRTKDQ